MRRAIAALPCRKYVPAAPADGGEAGEEAGTCAICLTDFEAGEEVRLLNCMHEFCKECIDVWIERQGMSASCPLCKRLLIADAAPGRNAQQRRTPAPAAPAAGSSSDAAVSSPSVFSRAVATTCAALEHGHV